MGIAVDVKKAKASTCRCYKIDPKGSEEPDNLMCFVPGIIGTLSDSQDREFCDEREVLPSSERFAKHIAKFKELGEILDKCFEAEVEDTWGCVADEAKKRASS